MKKTLFLFAALLASAIFNASFSADPRKSSAKEPPAGVMTLIINADVTVVLVNSENATIRVEGDDYFKEQVILKENGNKLTINSARNKDLKSRGIVYVPAGKLGYIKINSNAMVRSLNTLRLPSLDVVINGACQLYVVNTGELNLIETEFYEFELTAKTPGFVSAQ